MYIILARDLLVFNNIKILYNSDVWIIDSVEKLHNTTHQMELLVISEVRLSNSITIKIEYKVEASII